MWREKDDTAAMTVAGVGEQVSLTLLALPAGELGTLDRRQIAALVGVASFQAGSGTLGYASGLRRPSTTVALVMKVSEGVSGSDIAWPGPGAAVSIPTSGWSGQDCHGAATAAGTATV